MTSSRPRDAAWEWIGHELKDAAGEKIGEVLEIYVDAATGEPAFLAVATGWFGTHVSLVPVALTSPRGDRELVCQCTKEQVKQSPHVPVDGELSEAEEREVFAYYGLDYDTQSSAAPAGTAQQGWTPQLRRHSNGRGARSQAGTDDADITGDLLRPHPAPTPHDVDEHRKLNYPPGGEPLPR